jgi:hypothetical protein
MSSVHQAKLFAAFVECYRKRLTHLHREEESRTMHQSVENALQRARSTPQVVDTSTIKPSQAKPPVRPIRRKRTDWRFIFNTFLKMRYVQSGVITYRKHILILLQKTILPLLAFLLFLTTVIYYIIRWMQDGAAFINPLIFTLLAIPAFFAVLIWLGYHFVDWQNDIYQLTSDQILDIEKKPLGEESKKTGLLKDIQSIEHERENIIGIIFNFGTVTITVGQTRFYFYNVYNPDQVHQDIANARETLNRKNRAAEATRERERIVQWLVTLDEEQEKLRKVNENFEPKDERTG